MHIVGVFNYHPLAPDIESKCRFMLLMLEDKSSQMKHVVRSLSSDCEV